MGLCVSGWLFTLFTPKVEMASVIRCSRIQLKRKAIKGGGGAKPEMIVQRKRGGLEEVGGAEGLLGGIHHVEEAIFIPLLFIDLRDGSRHRHHAVAVDQEEEGLVGI